ncbi:Gfo/Idh/MocA family protein [Stakelama saccharophila]|uniref:Gfo/Idh/MocA family oxidoreductase n=1 Tax=Stakelama saccharophila TaxID=3075605 RepID=A0ABZ0B4W4_9SPHN|nr:Gfo/Idh/MocA family oxidoreductase [Stakelama sp. W311]WNO52430.1 Gfo/Idh/MocA family oxidoreductase [Stakelama sp. W311]
MAEHVFSRRNILQASAAGISVTFVSSAWAQQADPPMHAVGRPAPQVPGPEPLPENEKIGFAVVGLGKLALGQVLPAFGEAHAAKLAAVVSGNAEKAERVAAGAGLPRDAIYSYDSFDRIADDPRIQVVYIILPNALHADWTVRAFEAGKHVLCEKPMATSAADCQRMIDAAKAADRKLMIAYRCQYEPHNLEAMRRMRSGAIGAPRMVATDNGRPSDPSDPSDQWRLDRELSGGGALMDIGIYGINAARYLLNEEPVEVRAWTYTPKDDPRFDETPDVIGWQFRMPSGVLVNGSTSFSYHGTSRLEVMGEKGRLVLDPATNYRGIEMQLHGAEGERQPRIQAVDQFAREMDWMAQAVRGNRPIVSPGGEGMQDIRLMEAVFESLRKDGAPVRTDWNYARALDPAEAVKPLFGGNAMRVYGLGDP